MAICTVKYEIFNFSIFTNFLKDFLLFLLFKPLLWTIRSCLKRKRILQGGKKYLEVLYAVGDCVHVVGPAEVVLEVPELVHDQIIT